MNSINWNAIRIQRMITLRESQQQTRSLLYFSVILYGMSPLLGSTESVILCHVKMGPQKGTLLNQLVSHWVEHNSGLVLPYVKPQGCLENEHRAWRTQFSGQREKKYQQNEVCKKNINILPCLMQPKGYLNLFLSTIYASLESFIDCTPALLNIFFFSLCLNWIKI